MSKKKKSIFKKINELKSTECKKIIIDGIKTNYTITTEGHVISDNYARTGKRKYLSEAMDEDGYCRVILYINKKARCLQVHRLVALMFIPNPENKAEVNHKNGITWDNRVSNLEWVTQHENIIHAWKNGLASASTCDKHPNSVYSNKQIKKVCKHLEENKLSMREISKKTLVSYTVVKQIRNHIIWNDISKDFNIDNYSIDTKEKFTSEQIHRVCKLLSENVKQSDISEITGIPYATIHAIFKRKIRTNISKDYSF